MRSVGTILPFQMTIWVDRGLFKADKRTFISLALLIQGDTLNNVRTFSLHKDRSLL